MKIPPFTRPTVTHATPGVLRGIADAIKPLSERLPRGGPLDEKVTVGTPPGALTRSQFYAKGGSRAVEFEKVTVGIAPRHHF